MKLNLILATALVISVVSGLLIRSHPSRPNVEVLPEMVRTAAYKAYSANSNLSDGKTLQEPPRGTIPRGFHSVEYQATEADAIRAGEELKNPHSDKDLTASTRGEFVFRTWCFPCHGPIGKGDGPVTLRGFPAPPSFSSANTMSLKDGRMFHILSFGQKNMPSYASQISEDDRWRAIHHVRSLQKSAQATQAAPIPPAGQERQK